MAEFKLGRIRFVWKGNWTASTTYYQDDVVALGGKIYICVIGHESRDTFYEDFDITPPKWNLVSEGQTWKGDWATSTSYVYDDIVKYGARLYIANTNHTSAATEAEGLEADQSKWTPFAEGLDWKGSWTTSTQYKVNDFVKYGGSSYVCNTAHTSAATEALGLENDISNWDLFNQGLDYKNTWASNTRYKINDVVRYGAGSWIATAAHTSTDDFGTDIANWEKFAEGFQYEDEWNYENNYQPGDVVRYGGNHYIAITDNNNKIPSTQTADWDLFSEGVKFLGDWGEDSSAFEYKVGEVVRLGGFTYRCVQDHQNQQPPNATYWERFNSGFEWRGEWIDEAEYFEGDVVRFGDNSYVCINSHISDGDDYSSNTVGAENSRPDLDITGTYWNIFVVGTEQSVLTTTGDLVYYSGSAPTRLPIGLNGQVLTVNENNLPEWAFLGSSEDVYYVAEHGKDEPAPIYGQTIDRPFRSIRYAAEQVEKGAKNPNARRLLEMNRKFIQREITEWIDFQISSASPGDIFENLDYNSIKCERDMGYIVDALVWDITHGGNVRSREAALSYVNDTVGSPYLTQKAQTVAAINYGLTVIEAVLNQEAPDVNYQALNGDNSTAIVTQFTDNNLNAEPVLTTITSLVGIITDAITAGVSTNIPDRLISTTLIRVSTGKFYEVLPIIVPAECCIMGDEVRATHALPRKVDNATLTPKTDFNYTSVALERMEEIIGDVVEGISVTATTGNAELQDQTWPYAETDWVAPQIQRLVRTTRREIDSRLGNKVEGILTPAYAMTNEGAGNSRDLFIRNKEFIQAEIVAYIADQYPNLKYSRTKCKQDVGFIIDAVAYDLTYGGNWFSVEAGKAYFNGNSGVLQIAGSEKTATLAAYGYLKDLLQTTGRNITVTPTYQDAVEQVSGIGGTAGASTTIGNLMDDLIEVINLGYDNAPAITYPTIAAGSDVATIKTAIESNISTVQTNTIDFINKNFGSFTYNSAVCRRDLTNILTDVAYDIALGTNYNAVFNGIAYTRPTNAYNIANQRTETIGSIRYAKNLALDEVTDSTAQTRITTAFNEIVDILDNGTVGEAVPGDGVVDALSFPAPSVLPTTDAQKAFDNLEANKDFIVADVVGYVDDNSPPAGYDAVKCARDVGYIVDALKYDILYGGDSAAHRIAESYFGIFGAIYPAGQVTETVAAYNHLSTIAQAIVQEQDVTPQTSNTTEIQTKLGDPAGATEATVIDDSMTIITSALTAGNTDGLGAVNYPNLASLSVSSTLQAEKTAIDSARAQIILDTIQYISNTYNDFNYNHAKCSRDINLIAQAALYDSALETNLAGMFAAYSYLRAPSTNVVKDQKAASIAAFEYAKTQLLPIVESEGANPETVLAFNNTWEWIVDIIFSATPEGGNSQVDDEEVYNAIRMLELNKEFMVSEVQAYVDDWFYNLHVTETDGGTSELVVADTSGLRVGMPLKFEDVGDSTSAVEDAGISLTSTYYVKEITSDTRFTISLTPDGTQYTFQTESSGFTYDKEKCRRDTGIIVDGVGYDLALGTNYNQVTSGLAYARANASDVTGGQLTQTVAGITYAKSLAANLPNVRSNATALSRSNGAFDEIIDILQNGSGNADALSFPAPSTASTNVQNAVAQLIANRAFLQAEVTQYITDNYPALVYDSAKCERDVGYLVDALCYDIMYGGNSASVQAAEAYFVGTASQLGAGQATATAAAFDYLASAAGFVITETTADVPTGFPLQVGVSQDTSGTAASATEATLAATLLQITEDVITAGDLDDLPVTTYPNLSGVTSALRNAQLDMIDNKKLIIKRTVKYLDDTYSKLFKIAPTYIYSKTMCARDVREIVDAIKMDLIWPQEWKRDYTDNVSFYLPGCYRTKLAARYYANAVIGSQEEDFFYMRNGTGIRNMTLDGLQGDLTAENEYGTSRVTAGAYCSLDPGWGPDHEAVWITARSPYLQNNACFGYAAIGQKIDGALHNGGNDSIVSNDFTQLISDGIGAWITNNGRAELVSVFTYYSYLGYLAENGGRIRATNGNNSYGTFGSVAEGTDEDETPITAIVDNIGQYNATISQANTDADQVFNLEFSHAGNDYTEAEIALFGPGDNEVIVADEFRDDAVVQVRVENVDDSSGNPNSVAGGSGYTIVSNTAQSGSSTGIFLAATDGNLSTAYPGMKVVITGGSGIGLYGIIDTYDSGTKEATVVKESDGSAGWDHMVPGWPFEAPNASSTYQIEPAISFSAPTRSASSSTIASNSYSAVTYFETSAEYTNVSASTESDGTGATFDVIRNGSKYYVTLNAAGTGYNRLDVVTIHGSNLGGNNTDHSITVTITTINEATGAIIDFDFTGYGQKGKFIALPASGTTGAVSVDGDTWTTETLPSPGSGTWSNIAHGLLDDGSSTFKQSAAVAVCDGSSNVAYTIDGDTWNTSTLPGAINSAAETDVAYGNVGLNDNRFVVISVSDRDLAYSNDGGANWNLVTNGLPSVGFNTITYGKGLFVALASGTNSTVWSEDGGATWSTGSNLPTKNWLDVVWGNGRFVAIADDGTCTYSLDGKNWNTAITISGTASPSRIAYGHGMFAVTDDTASEVHYSEYGLLWSQQATAAATSAITFGNPNKTGMFIGIGSGTTTTVVDARLGAIAKGRANVANEQVFEVRLLEPGSGYTSEPIVTVTDPNNIDDVLLNVRLGSGAVANPTFIHRGTGFTTASADIIATRSNGYADFLQDGAYIAVKRLSARPVAGSNVVFDHLPNRFFKLVSTLSFLGDNDGSYTAFLQVSPSLEIFEAPPDGTDVSMRIRFSQVRLTGHDFLDIGTGGFAETNYPNTPLQNPDQTKETVDNGGGRVFYTSTDQDGNFRVGDLFQIEQATGVATLNAEAFNIAGLQELSLGTVTLGGNSASITEFSTDPFFTANSDTVVPTQRAVKAYIESQIGGGGASLNVNSVTAGEIFIGTDQITTVSGNPINIKANVVFQGQVLGLPLAYNYYYR